MDTRVTDAAMEDATIGCCGIWQLPWNGWEEELLDDCTSFTLGDVGCGGLPLAETLVKAECASNGRVTGDNSAVSTAASNGFDESFDIPADMGFPGDLSEVFPLLDGCDHFDLPDLFDASEPFFDSGFGNFLETSVSAENSLLQHHVEAGSYLESSTNSDAGDGVCLMTTGQDEICEMSNASSLKFQTVDELVMSCSETVIDSVVESSNHVADQNPLDSDSEIDADDSNDDDDDWEWTRKPKRGKRRRLCIGGSSVRDKKLLRKDPQLRKKEQNKNAATRYREKKKVEELERLALCEQLEKRNRDLRKEIEDKENEVKLLKDLLVTVLRPAVRN